MVLLGRLEEFRKLFLSQILGDYFLYDQNLLIQCDQFYPSNYELFLSILDHFQIYNHKHLKLQYGLQNHLEFHYQ